MTETTTDLPTVTTAEPPVVFELIHGYSLSGSRVGVYATEDDAVEAAQREFASYDEYRDDPDVEDIYDEIIWFIGTSWDGPPVTERVLRGQYGDRSFFFVRQVSVQRILDGAVEADRAQAERFLREWSRPYFGDDRRDAVAAVQRAATAAGYCPNLPQPPVKADGLGRTEPYADPDLDSQHDEDGEPIDGTLSAGWDVSFGCRINFGPSPDGDLRVHVSVSDHAKRSGVAVSPTTPQQLRTLAAHLLAVADSVEPAAPTGADTTDRVDDRAPLKRPSTAFERPPDGVYRLPDGVVLEPVGPSAEPDKDEREALIDALVMTPMADHVGTDLAPVQRTADALLAAGYRRTQGGEDCG